ncbi:ABC transporter [Penicillium frequentans]|uniref:ABC transporter n=1 Tax=Penicillium frequentans TaxID=3151616 RepID=A0AAD6CK57_9EURO|nr:ABC transporter [Penicillium glabrum]
MPKTSPDYFGQALIGAYVLEYFGMAVVTSIYWRQAFRWVTMIRAGLVSMIHRRLMKSRTVDVKESEAVTLMEVDVDRIVRNLRNLHEVWACLMEIIIAIWLLEREMGAVCVVPALISILSVAASLPVSKRFKNSQQLWVQRIGQRVITTAGVLSNIKAVKMLGLNKAVYSLVAELRELELQTSQRFRKLLIWTIALSNVPSDLAPFATFLAYAIVSIVKGNGYLLSAQAFTSLSLISLLTSPLLKFIQTTPGLFQSEACFNRIEEFFLQNVDLVIKRKSITMVIGPVGSGKTALLESIMGETTLREGTLTVKTSRIAYCSQNSWIFNDTIRSNITGDGDIDEKWYDFVLQVCCLKGDLQRTPQGDMFTCGSGGVALSGGQKQRIALARAIYSRTEVIILDDIFAGLDPKNLSSLSTQLLGNNGYLRKAGKTIIIATQNPRLVRFADNIISLNNGILKSQINSKEEIDLDKPEALGEWEDAEGPSGEISPPGSTVNTADTKSRKDKTDEQSRQKGGSGVYRFYLQRSGVGVVVCFIAAMNLEGACGNVASVWIQQWSSANAEDQKDHVGMYLGVYAVFLTASTFGLMAGCWLLFITIINRAAIRMHSDLLGSVLGAPFHVLHSTDLGSLVNRFSEDMTLIDMDLPSDAINVVASSTSCIVKIIIACVFGKYLTAAMPVLVAVLWLVQSYYLRTSRQVRLLDIESKASLVSHFLETMQGITTLKALGWSSRFQKAFESSFGVSQKPFYMLYCIQQWLTLVLDLITGTMAIILIAITTSLRDHFSGGSIGVALYMIMTLNQALAQLINYWISMETSIGAVYRVKTFLQDTPSESDHACSTEASFSKGAIEIANLTVSYNPSTAPVLKGLSLNILPGEKVAICGQSGSGKTSLVLALLQMMEVQDGYIKIDETNLAELTPDSVRACLSVVSQDQFLLPGTVRLNMDPYKRTSDEKIEQALSLVGLWDRISSAGGLEMELKSSEWSVGEKQLLALARAMVIRSPVLILDEATSSVDLDTEALMQRVIADHFSSQTVVSVIHRFGHIRQFDRVILIKDGVIVENDSPATLLGAETELRKLYDLTQ